MTKANLDSSKQAIFQAIATELAQRGLSFTAVDSERPWGGFYVIDEAQTAQFIDAYFTQERGEIALGEQKLSPKILIVEPGKRLSWQYHHRRTELWKVINGKAGVVLSNTDEETAVQTQNIGDVIRIGTEQRHRIVGLDSWGVLAEIWQHSDPSNPSNEDDIVRVTDDFGR
jgi:mannose-6-phosphate isomerase-like protein (cupin superfamily)